MTVSYAPTQLQAPPSVFARVDYSPGSSQAQGTTTGSMATPLFGFFSKAAITSSPNFATGTYHPHAWLLSTTVINCWPSYLDLRQANLSARLPISATAARSFLISLLLLPSDWPTANLPQMDASLAVSTAYCMSFCMAASCRTGGRTHV